MVVCHTGELEDSAVLRRAENGNWTCTTCERNKLNCHHMNKEDGTSRLPAATREDLEGRYEKYMDADKKYRRLTCLSRLPVPEDIQDSEYAEQYTSAFPPYTCKACLVHGTPKCAGYG
jgi:hypothetical protein